MAHLDFEDWSNANFEGSAVRGCLRSMFRYVAFCMDVKMLHDQGQAFCFVGALRGGKRACECGRVRGRRVSCHIPNEHGGTRFVPGCGASTYTSTEVANPGRGHGDIKREGNIDRNPYHREQPSVRSIGHAMDPISNDILTNSLDDYRCEKDATFSGISPAVRRMMPLVPPATICSHPLLAAEAGRLAA